MQDFPDYYRRLSDDELIIRLASAKDLVPEAKAALAAELSSRAIAEKDVEEVVSHYCEAAHAEESRKEQFPFKQIGWLLRIATPWRLLKTLTKWSW